MTSPVAGLTPLYGKAFLLTNGGSAGRLPGMEYLQPLLRASLRAFLAQASGWLRWAAKCGYCSLGNCNVLLNGSGARSDSADDAPVKHDGYAAPENDNFAGITFLNTEQWLTRLRQARQIRGRFIEDSGRHRLIDSKVNAGSPLSYIDQAIMACR